MKRNKLSTGVFYTLIVLMILFVVSTYLSSGLVAKYTSTDSATDSARVAKWDIDFLDSKGAALESVVTSTHLESGNSGSWGLDISNNSEVAAKFANSSNIRLRLQSPSFDAEHDHDTWDFLHDNLGEHINNPINFEIYMYNCSLKDIDVKNDETRVKLLDTSVEDENPLKFDMVIEEGILYYETIVNIGSMLNNDFILSYLNEETPGQASLVVKWSVEEVAGAVDTSTKYLSYHVIETSEYSKEKYKGIVSVANNDNITLLENANVTEEVTYTYGTGENEKKYVIAYKEHEYFEYLIYSSSVGGEVMITIIEDGKIYRKRSTKLSSDDIAELNARSIADVTDLDTLNQYIEKLGYYQYLNFEETKSNYDKVSGYISLGLTCRIILDLKVEQVD